MLINCSTGSSLHASSILANVPANDFSSSHFCLEGVDERRQLYLHVVVGNLRTAWVGFSVSHFICPWLIRFRLSCSAAKPRGFLNLFFIFQLPPLQRKQTFTLFFRLALSNTTSTAAWWNNCEFVFYFQYKIYKTVLFLLANNLRPKKDMKFRALIPFTHYPHVRYICPRSWNIYYCWMIHHQKKKYNCFIRIHLKNVFAGSPCKAI